MKWHEASQLIKDNIKKGASVNTEKSTYRIVEEVPPFKCKKYNYKNEPGYKVWIGGTNTVEIPLSMLEAIFNLAVENKGIYNNGIFEKLYSKHKETHGCHVHVVGKIFEMSGFAKKIGNNYEIL